MKPVVPPDQQRHDAMVQQGRRQPHQQRHLGALEDPRQHVAAGVIGAERVLGRGCLQAVLHAPDVVHVRRQLLGKDGDEDQPQQDDAGRGAERLLA